MSTDVTIDDIWQLFKESERIMRERDARLSERIEESERIMRERDARLSVKIEQVSKEVGRLGGRWGEFVEGLIAPSCIAMFAERGIQV
ncbi:MAG: hypothetical protein H7837_00005, partial [Magnetococcus sp. MYC-9]